MKSRKLSFLSLLTVLAMVVFPLAGCGTAPAASNPPATTAQAVQSASAALTPTAEPTPAPLQPITLSELAVPDSQLDPITGGARTTPRLPSCAPR